MIIAVPDVPIPVQKRKMKSTIFSSRLSQRMEQVGMNQAALSRASGIAPAQINRSVLGSTPTGETLVKLAIALKTSTDYLLGKSDVAQQAEPETPEEHALISAYRSGNMQEVNRILLPRIAQALIDHPELLEDE